MSNLPALAWSAGRALLRIGAITSIGGWLAHTSQLAAPSSENLPPSQSVQDSAPAPEYVPIAHSVHAVAPVLMLGLVIEPEPATRGVYTATTFDVVSMLIHHSPPAVVGMAGMAGWPLVATCALATLPCPRTTRRTRTLPLSRPSAGQPLMCLLMQSKPFRKDLDLMMKSNLTPEEMQNLLEKYLCLLQSY